ncbi:MAG: hypothetical protein AAGA96_07170 [Verrucomicrobiota bacterium]
MPSLPPHWPSIQATVVRGHQVASGAAQDPRFPNGTLAMQMPYFLEGGLDLTDWHLATINLSVAPWRYEILAARQTFRQVQWHPIESAEDFSFFDCLLNGNAGLIYYPHPDTKPDHPQPEEVLEVLLPKRVERIEYGISVSLAIDPRQVRFLDLIGQGLGRNN